ncbi:hypothetical protein ACTHAM_002445 [Cellulomonas soli]|uniref:hypothetical protein n=1 Tax=Cellulomonas soli TaxID=931535 RepID=UPI003F8361CE
MTDDLTHGDLPADLAGRSVDLADLAAGGVSGAQLVPADVARAMDCLGLRVVGPVGTEGTGWLGESTDGRGAAAELHVVPAVVDDALAARADALRAIVHEHLARVHDVLEIAPGRLALVVEHVPGPTLRELRAARAPLTDAEAATVAIPLSGALEALHAAGTAHGAVSATSVVLRPDGTPVLVDLRGSLLGAGSPAGDVGRLVATVLDQMPDEDAHRTAGDTGTLREELVGLVGEPSSAAAVAVACLRVVRPEPLRMPDAVVGAGSSPTAWTLEQGDVPSRPTSARQAPSRPHGRPALRPRAAGGRPGEREDGRGRRVLGRPALLVGACLVSALVLGFGARMVTIARPHQPDQAAPAAEATSVPTDSATAAEVAPASAEATPEEAAAALTTRRAQVLAAGDPEQLAAVEVPGSPAHTADVALMASLAGMQLEGYGVDVLGTQTLGADQTGDTRVTVTSSAREHLRSGPDGSTTVPATGPSTVVLVLRSTEDGWRVWDVEPAV